LFQAKWSSVFAGPLVVQTLAAHYAAIAGAEIIPALGRPKRAAIALAIATCGVWLHTGQKNYV
jgi:hypothetical protein